MNDMYVDSNWCPDCGEPRGVCRCDQPSEEKINNKAAAIEELKLCPFCGGKPEYKHNAYPDGRDTYLIHCPKCNYSIGSMSKEKLISQWRTRPIESALQDKISEANEERIRYADENIRLQKRLKSLTKYRDNISNLLDKFPDFNENWPNEKKVQWLVEFQKLIETVREGREGK